MKLKPKKHLNKSIVKISLLLLGGMLLISPVSASHHRHRGHHACKNCTNCSRQNEYRGFWFNYGPTSLYASTEHSRGHFSCCCKPDLVWIDGYRDWFDGAYVWIEGYWSVRPPGCHWVKGHWRMRGGRRVWEPAHWSKSKSHNCQVVNSYQQMKTPV